MLTVQTSGLILGSLICIAVFGGYFIAFVMIASAIEAIREKYDGLVPLFCIIIGGVIVFVSTIIVFEWGDLIVVLFSMS